MSSPEATPTTAQEEAELLSAHTLRLGVESASPEALEAARAFGWLEDEPRPGSEPSEAELIDALIGSPEKRPNNPLTTTNPAEVVDLGRGSTAQGVADPCGLLGDADRAEGEP